MKAILLITVSLYILSSSTVTGKSESYGEGDGDDGSIEWQLVTKLNLSSQIRLHPHLLLLITVPWSGESRALMKKLAHTVNRKPENFGTLKLRVLYKNSERMLADALGANEGPTFLYYHHSSSYKYQGRLEAQNILFSINSMMPLLPEELPFTPLNTPKDFNSFIESTDKAVILVDFCRWTPRLLAKEKNNVTENAFGVQGSFFATDSGGGFSRQSISKEKREDMQTEKLSCAVENKVSGISFLGELLSLNKSFPVNNENVKLGGGLSCTFEEFQQFESFFQKFITFTREFFLPLERQRYGLILERSLISSLGVEDSGLWFALVNFAGCPSCLKVFREVDDLKNNLQMPNAFVSELEEDSYDHQPVLPKSRPSILLFVDRSSESSMTREKSKEALYAFRHLALNYQVPYQMFEYSKNHPIYFSTQSRSTPTHPKLKLSPTRQDLTAKDKMSIVIIKEGKQVILDNIASNSQGNSLDKILAYIREQKKETTLSSMAKELGFQLLSDDLDIKVEDTLRSHDFQSNNLSPELPLEDTVKNVDEIPKDPTYMEITPQEKSTENVMNEEKSVLMAEKGWGNFNVEGFKGSFFFSDGGYQLLKSLTGDSKIPSLVIVDPNSMQHFVYLEGVFSNSTLSKFLDEFINGSLVPYQRSESDIVAPKGSMCPPFVNLDFHEADSIPRVSSLSLSNFVNACKVDVLVLFSNRWCGFCQRMELVVREVYRALKGYTMSRDEQRNKKLEPGNDDFMKLPQIYLMDCSLNECGSYLKSDTTQREIYPALILYPAEMKEAIPYEGDMIVTDVIKFIADHGRHSHHLNTENEIIWSGVESGVKNQNLPKNASSNAFHVEEVPITKKTTPKHDQIKPHKSNGIHKTTPQVGSYLVATEKLLNAPSFDKSTVLIINNNQNSGFQGLIINKLISWDSLQNLEDELKLLNTAPLSFGGPVVNRELQLVALARRFIKHEYPEILPGIYFLDHFATAQECEGIKLGNKSASDYWFFLGYSSWGWEQLFDEINEGAWELTENSTIQLDWPNLNYL